MSRMEKTRTDQFKTAILVLAAVGLIWGLAFHVAGRSDIADLIWIAGVVPALAALVVEILRSIGRGEVGLDIVAALSMTAALVFGETLAAAVVAVMYSGGTFLEAFAEGRARRSMRDLLSRVPRTATRHRNGALEEVPLDEIATGDRLLIRQGDVVPVDGTVASDAAFVDTSALTGESLPVRLSRGADAMSGSTNAGEAFDMTAVREAKDSTYAGIVRLVEEAQASKAPMSRLADRWSLGFLAVTVAIAVAAWWFTGDPIRAVAVLVVATPCPLILAVPVALVAGLSRAAHFGVLIKGAGPLETMARIRTLILDKTGTLTDGRPQIVSIESAGGMDEGDILRLAAALDEASIVAIRCDRWISGNFRPRTHPSRHVPGGKPSRVQSPTDQRMRRRVGWPTAAVIRRTWRFRPSVRVSSSQLSGMDLRARIGGSRGQSQTGSGITRASAGRVGPSFRSTPLRRRASAATSGSPSTCAR